MPEEKDNSKTENETEDDDTNHAESWMIRPYEIYKEEYDDCTSIKARFHQYFVFGKMIDCSQWKIDSQNAYLWNMYRSEAAYKALIESEKKHRIERLKGHYLNDVWEKRTEPPENWNAPLPEDMQKALKNTYLDLQNQKMKTGHLEPVEELKKRCTIL